MQIVGKRDYNRDLQETFQYSGATISLVFHKVLIALLILYQKTIILPTITEPLDSCITENTKNFPYFKDCLGALDNTYLSTHLLSILAPLYCNQKSWLLQNVLGVYWIDFTFYYIFEHDNWILEYALFNKNFYVLDKKYYLTDIGYYNMDYLFFPYPRVCYHLKE